MSSFYMVSCVSTVLCEHHGAGAAVSKMFNVELTHTHTHRHITDVHCLPWCQTPIITFCIQIGKGRSSLMVYSILYRRLYDLLRETNTLQGLLSCGGVCGQMSRCGCVCVQELPVQLRLRLQKKHEAAPPPPHTPLLHLGDGRAGKSKSESDLHISPLAIITLCYWLCFCFFYHSCRSRTDYFIRLFWLPPVEEVFTQRLQDQPPSSCQRASPRRSRERLSVGGRSD